MRRPTNQRCTAETAREFIAWFDAHSGGLPDFVRSYLQPLRDFLAAHPDPSKLSKSESQMFLRALGIIPSSEKRASGRPLESIPKKQSGSKKSENEEIKEKLERSRQLGDWHEGLKQRHEGRARKLEEVLSKMADQPIADAAEPPADGEQEVPQAPRLEDIKLTDEQKAASAAKAASFVEALQRGDGPDPSMTSSEETLMPSEAVLHDEKRVCLPVTVPDDLAKAHVEKTLSDTRVRYDFSVAVTRINLDIEKKVVVTDDGERRVITASASEYGPPRFAVTWSALATLAVMVGQFAIPLNRLGTLLSVAGKRFTASGLSRLLHYVASRFIPIYLHLPRQLANCDILAGDDTSCRVVEVSSHIAQVTSEDASEEKRKTKPPWDGFRTPEAAQKSIEKCEAAKKARKERRESGDRDAKPTAAETPPLGVRIGRILRFEWLRRNGDGPKQSMNTTVITGRTDANDPRSLIVFFRSHLGGFGNLLTSLLHFREAKRRDVTIQGDLSTTNLVTDPELLKRFNLTLIGCSAHSRRPFALYEQDDPVNCPHMLHLFAGLAMHEQRLDVHGRNTENVSAVRESQSRPLWQDIKELAQRMAQKWSKATKLGTAARYILRHFKKLTAYLENPRLDPTNNLRERLLRPEKLIEKSSMFRRSLEGRFVLDVIRTIAQTAVAAAVPVRAYIEFVLRADPKEVAEHPERFTPQAFRYRLENEENQRQSGTTNAPLADTGNGHQM